MDTTDPIPYSAAVEDIPINEQQTIEELKETFDVILKTTAENYDHAVRAVHAKAQLNRARNATIVIRATARRFGALPRPA